MSCKQQTQLQEKKEIQLILLTLSLLWFNPSQQLSLMLQPFPSPTSKIRERIWRQKLENSWAEQDSFIGKGKVKHTSKAKQGINSSLPMGSQVLSHPQESRAHHVSWLRGKMNTITLTVPPLYNWAWYHQVWKIPLVSWGQLPAASLPKTSTVLDLLLWRSSWHRLVESVKIFWTHKQNFTLVSPFFPQGNI